MADLLTMVRPTPPPSYLERLRAAHRARCAEHGFTTTFKRRARRGSDVHVSAHELAHAIAMLIYQLPISEAVIIGPRGRPRGGLARTDPTPLTPADEAAAFDRLFDAEIALPPFSLTYPLETHMIATAAGPMCDRLLDCEGDGSYNDRWTVERWAELAAQEPGWRPGRGHNSNVRQFVAQIEVKALDLVERHAGWIERASDALVKTRRLTAVEILSFKKDTP